MADMLLRWLLVLLLTGLFGQGGARASEHPPSHNQEVGHVTLHQQMVPHHHEGHERGFHRDDSDASRLHLLGDSGTQVPALLGSHASTARIFTTFCHEELRPRKLHQPYLGTLEKPPKREL